MDQNERGIIDDLFARLRKAEAQSQPRDPEAEALIARHIAAQPAAAYYMAQAIVVQQEALARAQSRVQDLERQPAERGSGGFFGGLFGSQEARSPASARVGREAAGFDYHSRANAGGGFLAGAMQTALGVATGFLIADAISGLLSPGDAAAATPEAYPHDAAATEENPSAHEDPDLSEEEAGGDVDFGGFDEL